MNCSTVIGCQINRFHTATRSRIVNIPPTRYGFCVHVGSHGWSRLVTYQVGLSDFRVCHPYLAGMGGMWWRWDTHM